MKPSPPPVTVGALLRVRGDVLSLGLELLAGAGGLERAIPEPREAVRARRIIRARRYPVRPLSVDEAALALSPEPDAFLVFRNTESDAVSVVFRRKDGDIGLIEPQA